MKIIDVVLPNSHEIVLAGDEQQGNLLFWEEGWNKCVDYVHEKSNRFLCHMGDQIEGIMVDDKRYDPKIHGFNYPLIQQRDCLKRLKKVKDRLLVILDSNHNHALWKLGDLAEDIVFELQKAGSKIQYGTFTCKLIVRDKDKKVMYKVYLSH